MTHTKYLLLCETANKCNDSYYKQHVSLISDIEFDNIMTMIEQAEAEHPEWVTPASMGHGTCPYGPNDNKPKHILEVWKVSRGRFFELSKSRFFVSSRFRIF